jgi:hypothetical protein
MMKAFRWQLFVKLVVCLYLKEASAIELVDQPRLFSTLSEWNQNLFRRVADCIRDTLPMASDTPAQVMMKNWAAPLCNDILRVLNENWTNTNDVILGTSSWGLRVIINQEFYWNGVASRLYGSNKKFTSCGLATSALPDCAYVTP